MFFYVGKLLFSGFRQFKSCFERDQKNMTEFVSLVEILAIEW